MSKSMTNKDLKQLAKYIVSETKEMEQIQTKKIYEKNKIKFDKMMKDENCRNSYIDELIDNVFEDYTNDFENEVELLYILKENVNDIEDILDDLDKEAVKIRTDLANKYKYIITSKLVDVGY
jgi:RNase P subunit RPR2